MKIILVIENLKRQNVFFVTENFQILSLDEAISATQNAKIENVHIVCTKSGKYLRSNPNVEKQDNLESLAVSYASWIKGLFDPKVIKNKSLQAYVNARAVYYEKKYSKSDLIYIDEIAFGIKKDVFSEIKSGSNNIIQAASKYDVDQYLLAGILIDEVCRKNLDDNLDFLGWFGINTSVGIAQIKIRTARDMIKSGYFPDLKEFSNQQLYTHLAKPQNNVQFAAARIQQIINHWKKHGYDISGQAGVIGQLYSQGLGLPNPTPGIEDRGKQISTEFYQWAKKLLES